MCKLNKQTTYCASLRGKNRKLKKKQFHTNKSCVSVSRKISTQRKIYLKGAFRSQATFQQISPSLSTSNEAGDKSGAHTNAQIFDVENCENERVLFCDISSEQKDQTNCSRRRKAKAS